ncbi:alpha/beta hydrolase [Kurthia sibirica]|uniref:Alpha/beta hydrolase n=2 Tax=Kurthia sibirica TaxID=202750 RepID=A0A2U3AR63_9BACL|nr:alpha/beta hydrolase [Kurthia sibirica]
MPQTTEIKGHIHIFHGMAEHQERYEKFARFLVEHHYIVSTHDHRGHGQTAAINNAQYGFFTKENGFDQIVEDAHTVIEQLRSGQDWPKVIILGHSMGSFVARRYIQLYSEEVKKVIIMGTAGINSSHRMGLVAAKLLAANKGPNELAVLLEKISFGSYNNKISNRNSPSDWLSSDEEEVRKYIEDELCGFTCTNQFYVDLLSGIILISKETEVNKIRKDLPILLISGKDDPVGEYGKGVWRVAKQYYHAGITHVAVHLLERKRHEILNEVNNEVVYQTILKWLEKKGHDRAATAV